ncbi:MAG: YpdA family putative bacillithiol disulfide reductase [Bacteroidota bacterium]|nr:YpdA family putative bacillithiol disulfide reductase [Bacteroidota bacterium]
MNPYDVLIIGGGPCGLACGIDAKKNNLSYIILEKGSIVESVRRYPLNMSFFSTSEMIEIGNIPFTSIDIRPTRNEALKYYRKVSDYFNLNLQLFTTVENIEKGNGYFTILTNKETYIAKKVVLAIGYYDLPRLLRLPGEELPHVSHYYDEPYKYAKTNVMVVGGANSAVETALDLFRNGAYVTLVHQFPTLDKTAKYWIVPDLENRIKKNEVKSYFRHRVIEIRQQDVVIEDLDTGEMKMIPADFVFLMVGYRPDAEFMQKVGINLESAAYIPQINASTFETNVEGIYVAGSVVGGEETAKIFIENGREHGKVIMENIKRRLYDQPHNSEVDS